VPPAGGARRRPEPATLSGGDAASLNQTLRNFEARKGSQIAVLIVPTTDGEAIEQFALRVAETWKIGRKKIDDGRVLSSPRTTAKSSHRSRVRPRRRAHRRHLPSALSMRRSRRKFKSGEFRGGISAGVNRMIRVIDGEKLPAAEPPHWQAPNLLNHVDPIFALFVLFGFRCAHAQPARCVARSTVTGCIVGVLAWYVSGSFGARFLQPLWSS